MTDSTIDLRVRLNKDENQRKFDELHSYMVNDIPDSKIDKTGNASAVRLAIQLAHEKMEEMKAEEKEVVENYNRIKRELEKKAEKV
jgi:hypothetical protein